jgi:hypothetical protein
MPIALKALALAFFGIGTTERCKLISMFWDKRRLW